MYFTGMQEIAPSSPQVVPFDVILGSDSSSTLNCLRDNHTPYAAMEDTYPLPSLQAVGCEGEWRRRD